MAEARINDQSWGKVDFLYIDTPSTGAEILASAPDLLAGQKPVLALNTDNPEDADKLIKQLRMLNYRLWWFVAPFFHLGNYFRNTDNLFNGYLSKTLIAVGDDRDLSRLHAKPL